MQLWSLSSTCRTAVKDETGWTDSWRDSAANPQLGDALFLDLVRFCCHLVSSSVFSFSVAYSLVAPKLVLGAWFVVLSRCLMLLRWGVHLVCY